jgi:methylated-DNA-protein-cysteine methyltransferase-like protein
VAEKTFPHAVAGVLDKLRPGDVVTYGEVAMEAGFPGAHRAVGTFLRDRGDRYPWWRVVRADGTLAASDPTEQARRLSAEGVRCSNGRVARGIRRGSVSAR